MNPLKQVSHLKGLSLVQGYLYNGVSSLFWSRDSMAGVGSSNSSQLRPSSVSGSGIKQNWRR